MNQLWHITTLCKVLYVVTTQNLHLNSASYSFAMLLLGGYGGGISTHILLGKQPVGLLSDVLLFYIALGWFIGRYSTTVQHLMNKNRVFRYIILIFSELSRAYGLIATLNLSLPLLSDRGFPSLSFPILCLILICGLSTSGGLLLTKGIGLLKTGLPPHFIDGASSSIVYIIMKTIEHERIDDSMIELITLSCMLVQGISRDIEKHKYI